MRCEHGEFSNVMLRDHFFIRILDHSIRKRLLSESKRTFERAVELATIVEHVSSDVAAMKSSDTCGELLYKIITNKVNQHENRAYNASSMTVKLINCPRCNYKYQYGRCKAFNEYCSACNMKGHYRNSTYCKFKCIKANQESLQQTSQDITDQRQIHRMDSIYLDIVLGITTEYMVMSFQEKADLRLRMDNS